MTTPQQILVDGPAWIGDMIMAQTLFKVLREQYPQATIDVMAPRSTAGVVKLFSEVDNFIELPFDHGTLQIRKRYQFAKNLREKHYDWAILTRNSFKSALIPFLAKIPRRTGWLGEQRYGLLNDWRKLNKTRYPMMIERFFALAYPKNTPLKKPYTLPQLTVPKVAVTVTLKKLSLSTEKPILALCPGAEYGIAKRWLPEHFATVAQKKLAQGWQVWLLGSPKDKPATSQVNEICENRCVDLAGRTALDEAIFLLSVANTVVANDSGLVHLAAALDKPLVAIYGPTPPELAPPLTQKAKSLSLHLKCSPCFKRSCPLGHGNCMKNLLPETVLQATEQLRSEFAS